MKNMIVISLVTCLTLASVVDAEPKTDAVFAKIKADVDNTVPKASDKLLAFIHEKLLPLCANKVFVAEVKAQNAKKLSLDDIKKIDKEWINAEDELPIHNELLSNACAKEIERLVKELGVIGEVFVMDNQGANVGQNGLTSDYWQGDESKWKNSFNDGKGGVDIGKLKYDKSSGESEVKVSLPIIDEDGSVVGAVCWGVKASQL